MYASRSLNKAEINYPTIQKEPLAIYWAVKYFRPYLYGRRFKMLTDHRPLVYLFSLTDPSSRLTKFRLGLELKHKLQKVHHGPKTNLGTALKNKTGRNSIQYKNGGKISSPRYVGQYLVVEDVSPNVKILKNNKEILVH